MLLDIVVSLWGVGVVAGSDHLAVHISVDLGGMVPVSPLPLLFSWCWCLLCCTSDGIDTIFIVCYHCCYHARADGGAGVGVISIDVSTVVIAVA